MDYGLDGLRDGLPTTFGGLSGFESLDLAGLGVLGMGGAAPPCAQLGGAAPSGAAPLRGDPQAAAASVAGLHLTPHCGGTGHLGAAPDLCPLPGCAQLPLRPLQPHLQIQQSMTNVRRNISPKDLESEILSIDNVHPPRSLACLLLDGGF